MHFVVWISKVVKVFTVNIVMNEELMHLFFHNELISYAFFVTQYNEYGDSRH